MMNEQNPISSQDGDHAGRLTDLWNRHVASESLTEADRKRLRDSIRDNLSFRQLVLDDQWIDQSLRVESTDTVAVDAFVAGVLMRCEQVAMDAPPIESHDTAASSTTPPPTIRQTLPPGTLHDSAFPPEEGLTLPAEETDIRLPQLQLRQSPLRLVGKRSSRSARREAWGWFAAAAAMLISLGSAGLWYSAGVMQEPRLDDERRQAMESNRSESTTPTDRPVVVAQSAAPVFATVTAFRPLRRDTTTPQSATAFQVGTSFGQQAISVQEGELQLMMASGVVVELFSPSLVELLTENSIKMTHGELSASVPPSANGFQVATPSIVVTDLGTVFDVAVQVDGTTDVEVRRGSVSVASREQVTQQRWHLHEDDVYQLTFYRPPSLDAISLNPSNQQTSLRPDGYPIASLARNQAGETTGVISLDGRSMKFDDEVVFATVRDNVFRGIQESPMQVSDSWKQFVETRPSSTEPSGAITVNGVEFAFNNFNEAIRTQNRLREKVLERDRVTDVASEGDQADHDEQNVPAVPLVAPQTPNFRGTLIINGQQRTFESAEQYNAAMKELLGPAAQFGFKFSF